MAFHPLFEPQKTPYVPIVAAVVGSVVFHASLPMLDRVKVPQPETRSLVEFLPETPPDPLGDVDNVPVEIPDEPLPADAPPADEPPVPADDPPPAPDPPPDDTEGVKVTEPPPAPPADPVPEEPPAPPAAAESGAPDEPRNDPVRMAKEVVQARASRFNRRLRRTEAEIVAERARRAAAWRAQRDAEKKAREDAKARRLAKNRRDKKEVGPVPEALKKGGTPNAIWICDDHSKGFRADVQAERDASDWASLVPTVLLVFPTTPNLMTVLGDTAHVQKRKRKYQRKLGLAEFALPHYEIQVDLDAPGDTVAYLGRNDARCLVGVRYKKGELFPMEILRVPIRVVQDGRTTRSLVDIEFLRDGTFELTPRDEEGVATLAFSKGRLRNAGLIEETIDTHFFAVETLNDVGKFIGVDVGKMMRDKRKKQAKANAKHDQNMRKLEQLKKEQEARKAKKKADAAGEDKKPSTARGRRGSRR